MIRRALLLAFLATGSWVRAHDPGLSTGRFEVRLDEVRLVAAFAPADAEFLLPADQRGRDYMEARPAFEAAGRGLYRLTLDGRVLPLRELKLTLHAGDNLEFDFVFGREAGRDLELRPRFFGSLPAGHRQYATVVDGRGALLAERLLSADTPDIRLTLAPEWAQGSDPQFDPPPRTPVATGEPNAAPVPTPHPFRSFLVLGIEHILTGYDHLLFLLGLVVVCARWRAMLLIITSFTVGHSLTLILATFDQLTVPAAFVEPAIAASIVYVGVENLMRGGREPGGRWGLTFAFGLIHGFGFAGILRELEVEKMPGGMLVPLFSFNLGVELGQIALAAICLPLLWRLRRWPPFLRMGVPALSAMVGLAGFYWLLERTLLSR